MVPVAQPGQVLTAGTHTLLGNVSLQAGAEAVLAPWVPVGPVIHQEEGRVVAVQGQGCAGGLGGGQGPDIPGRE